jgi:6-pyruvoyl-tetrahydropterin synthase
LSKCWWAARSTRRREWWWIWWRSIKRCERVLDRFDHANLNLDPLFADRVPTTENFAGDLLIIERCVAGGQLEHVRVEETENNFFECSLKDKRQWRIQ